MAISVDTKVLYDFDDYMFVLSLFLTVLSGIIMQFIHYSQIWSCIMLFFACSFFTYSMYLAVMMIQKTNRFTHRPNLSGLNSAKATFKFEILARKRMLLRCLLCLLPIFPCLYFLSFFQIISSNTRISGLLIASALNKILFASLCTDARLEVTHPSIYFLDLEEKLAFEKRSFLRYIFHEIRVPLNSVSLGIQNMMEFIGPSNYPTNNNNNNNTNDPISTQIENKKEQNDAMNMMKDAAGFMGDILNDVLAIQKIEEGDMKLIYKPFDLNSLLQICTDPFHALMKKKKVELQLIIDKKLNTYVRGDKYRLNHVLSKILSNAVKHAPRHSRVYVEVSTQGVPYESSIRGYLTIEQTELENRKVQVLDYRIVVMDEGLGLSKDTISTLFSPYVNTAHGEVKKGRGTGLGLVICKDIIELHGGSLHCESIQSHGCSFIISLPLEILTKPNEINLTKNRSFFENYSNSLLDNQQVATDQNNDIYNNNIDMTTSMTNLSDHGSNISLSLPSNPSYIIYSISNLGNNYNTINTPTTSAKVSNSSLNESYGSHNNNNDNEVIVDSEMKSPSLYDTKVNNELIQSITQFDIEIPATPTFSHNNNNNNEQKESNQSNPMQFPSSSKKRDRDNVMNTNLSVSFPDVQLPKVLVVDGELYFDCLFLTLFNLIF